MYIYGYLNRIRRAVQAFIQRLATYTNRVLTDGGEVQDADITRSIINHLYANGTYANTRLLFVPEAGIKVRESGINKFVTYGYDLADAEVDSDTELITNGNFDTDITGWSKPADLTGNTQLTWETGQLKIRSTTASRGAATQAITTTPNKYYHVSFLAAGGDGRSRLLIGLSENDGGILDSGDMASDFNFDYTFRATAETTYITLVKHEGVAGTYVLFDSVSVKESINQANDLSQTTETRQPYLSGNIAPNERLAVKNPNGDARYLTHPEISFGSSESWSVTCVFKNFWNNLTSSSGRQALFSGGSVSTTSAFFLNYFLRFVDRNGENYILSTSLRYSDIFKNSIFTIVYDKTAIILYINGLEVGRVSTNAVVVDFRRISGAYPTNGNFLYHCIQSGAMSLQQIQAEHTFLRSLYPEIESVTIGTQEWATSNCEMVATPMGNVIREVQNASFATTDNKIPDASAYFATNGTSYWIAVRSTLAHDAVNELMEITIADDSGPVGIYRDLLNPGKLYRVKFKAKSTNGYTGQAMSIGDNLNTDYVITNPLMTIDFQNYEFIIRPIGTLLRIYLSKGSIGNIINIDNIEVKEISWDDSQDLYDAMIAAGESVQTAVKEAAMWCYYNNDPALGAVYGKLYNWFAVKLLQNDIEAYNAANQTAHWGWHIPSQAEFETLVTTLGGTDVAGGKMKVEGTNYWKSPNTGADNSSGFSNLGIGWRNESGLFFGFQNNSIIGAISGKALRCFYNAASIDYINYENWAPKRGAPIRLLKD